MNFPKFTPDGQHLLWIGARRPQGGHDRDTAVLVVDGKPSPVHFMPFGSGTFGNWEMSADGVLTFVARTGDAIKRFRVTPSSETSIAATSPLPVPTADATLLLTSTVQPR